mgnify:CR=1 FL=1
MADAPGRSSRYGPVVLAGVAAAVAAAVAGNQEWARLDDSGGGATTAVASASVRLADATAPPVTSLALVVLATWGVLLVARGRARRAVTWLGLVAALGVASFAVVAWVRTPATLVDTTSVGLSASRTAWAHVGVVVGLAVLVTSALAVAWVSRWPEMGRRYDAPGAADEGTAAPADAVPAEDRTNLDLWRAIDEGRDPTEGPTH